MLLLIILLLLPVILAPRLVPIKAVRCETSSGACSQTLNEKLSTINLTNYTATKNAITKVMSDEVFVKEYAIRFVLPSAFIVYVVEREPIAALAREGATSDYAYIDHEGFIIGVWQETTLPILIVDKSSEFAVGQQIPQDLMFATTVTYQAFKKYNSRLSVLKSDGIEVDLPIGVKAIFPKSGDADALFGALTLILSRLNTAELTSRIDIDHLPSTIDLRYKNPVLR